MSKNNLRWSILQYEQVLPCECNHEKDALATGHKKDCPVYRAALEQIRRNKLRRKL